MKSSASHASPPPPAFTPVKLELVFETQTELDAFANLFNHTDVTSPRVTQGGGQDGFNQIAQVLQRVGATLSGPVCYAIRDSLARSAKESLLSRIAKESLLSRI